MSNDFTRCFGSLKECVQYIPYRGQTYSQVETLYEVFLEAIKEKATCTNFESFYGELLELEEEGRLELRKGVTSNTELGKLMEKCIGQLKISNPRRMYRKTVLF